MFIDNKNGINRKNLAKLEIKVLKIFPKILPLDEK